jgi:hypothetical protein
MVPRGNSLFEKINVGISTPSFVSLPPSATDLIDPSQAALYLGVTSELLFFYTSRSFQKRPGENRRLPTHEIDSSTRFLVLDLDEFDHYLSEPWAEVGDARRDPPQKVLAYLHAESGGCCMRCGSGVAVQTAHIDPWANSRCNHHHNLLRICSACHSEHDVHNSLSSEELRKLKASGIERLRESLRIRLNLGPRFPTPTPDPVFVGRDEDLTRLRDSVRTDRCLLVHGPGGIGKTQLVLRALQSADTRRPVLWIEVERYVGVEALQAALEVSLRSANESRAQPLEALLDKMQACLVIDGLEQLKGPDIDAIDDWIASLQARGGDTQIVITSQADLALARIDYHARITGIEADASAQVLFHYIRSGIPTDEISLGELISFADGHPLTLRIAATLVNHYGSVSAAWGQIRTRGAHSLEIQKRSTQNRLTSLKTCLSLAYDALADDERKLLFLVANAPGGLFSGMLDEEKGWLIDARSAIAGAWRWGLIDVRAQGDPRERVRMLSPIASYAITRWREEKPQESQELSKDLAKHLAVMAAVIDMHSEKNGGIPNMLSRFEEELPNLLRVLDIAENECDDKELGDMASAVCSSLMRYFFVTELGDSGCKVMLRGARLALRNGREESASGLVSQMLTLAHRSQGVVDIRPAIALMSEIESKTTNAQTLGNLALCRAVIGSREEKQDDVEAHACAAIRLFEQSIATSDLEQSESFDNESIKNDLSSSYALLGGALLAKRSFAAAAGAYRKSLGLVRGQSVAVNEGQLHHQIGNCEANLGNPLTAASHYTLAATQFHAIGMRGYLGNALGEFGNLLIEFGTAAEWPALPDIKIVEAGIKDVSATIELTFGQYPFELADCAAALRNLFGMTVLVGFSNAERPLAFPKSLLSDLLPWAEEAVYEMDDIWVDEFGSEAVHNLRSLLNLEAAIAQFERRTRQDMSDEIDIAPLAVACSSLGYWGGLHEKGCHWLMTYAVRRWAAPSKTTSNIRDQLSRWKLGDPLLVPLDRGA